MRQTQGSVEIAKIFGVQLKLHFSLIFLLLYVVFVSSMQFPVVLQSSGVDPELLRVGPWFSGFIFAVGLFFSVAVHEYGHVWVAQAQGVKVRSVTLMMLGGVSEMEKVPEHPYAEFKLAVIGPIVSLALSGLFWFIHNYSQSWPEITLFSFWLASANLVLGIFNLLPAFPMDGGRALRSLLAVKFGHLKATQTSVRVSKGMAWALGFWGLFTFNFVLIFIAFFIFSVAESELFMVIAKGVLNGLHVSDAMTSVRPISCHLSLSQAATQMRDSKCSILPVIATSGRGALLALDNLKRIPQEAWGQTEVSQVMEPVPQSLNTDDSLSEVLPSIALSSLKTLPVQAHGQIVGVIRYSDVAEMIRFKSLDESTSEETTRSGKDAA